MIKYYRLPQFLILYLWMLQGSQTTRNPLELKHISAALCCMSYMGRSHHLHADKSLITLIHGSLGPLGIERQWYQEGSEKKKEWNKQD